MNAQSTLNQECREPGSAESNRDRETRENLAECAGNAAGFVVFYCSRIIWYLVGLHVTWTSLSGRTSRTSDNKRVN